jgi:hypothetical protein
MRGQRLQNTLKQGDFNHRDDAFMADTVPSGQRVHNTRALGRQQNGIILSRHIHQLCQPSSRITSNCF